MIAHPSSLIKSAQSSRREVASILLWNSSRKNSLLSSQGLISRCNQRCNNNGEAFFCATSECRFQCSQTRYFTSSKEEQQKKNASTGDSLRDAINKIKSDESDKDENKQQKSTDEQFTTTNTAFNEIMQKTVSLFDSFKSEVAKTWEELVNSSKPSSVNKIIHAPMNSGKSTENTAADGNVDNEAADKYQGVSALAIVKQNTGAWERMQQRLAEAPIIKNILGASHELYKKSGAQHAKRKIDDIRADAAEAWETSQNPWVYRLSSVYDTLTAESEFALAVKELRRLDPDFVSLDKFKDDAMETMIPEILSHIMAGRTKELKPLLGEAVYNRLAAEIRVRKSEGLIVDPHILGMENSEILAAELDDNNRGSPIVLLHFMCQQINCVRNKDGEVVEGGEDEIRANSYVVALQREYNDEEGALNWKMIDFRFNGGIPWI
mmetsp:Transcript_19976/g.28422  ORF Transcript_19976/g.28422 Transcript_19976/m.28422 type:complete len:436 (+) Transcript_19976:71-1378(+)